MGDARSERLRLIARMRRASADAARGAFLHRESESLQAERAARQAGQTRAALRDRVTQHGAHQDARLPPGKTTLARSLLRADDHRHRLDRARAEAEAAEARASQAAATSRAEVRQAQQALDRALRALKLVEALAEADRRARANARERRFDP